MKPQKTRNILKLNILKDSTDLLPSESDMRLPNIYAQSVKHPDSLCEFFIQVEWTSDYLLHRNLLNCSGAKRGKFTTSESNRRK
jgi:hypothetical protein